MSSDLFGNYRNHQTLERLASLGFPDCRCLRSIYDKAVSTASKSEVGIATCNIVQQVPKPQTVPSVVSVPEKLRIRMVLLTVSITMRTGTRRRPASAWACCRSAAITDTDRCTSVDAIIRPIEGNAVARTMAASTITTSNSSSVKPLRERIDSIFLFSAPTSKDERRCLGGEFHAPEKSQW